MMLKTVIVGATGYTGAELAKMIHDHPHLTLEAFMFRPTVQMRGSCSVTCTAS